MRGQPDHHKMVGLASLYGSGDVFRIGDDIFDAQSLDIVPQKNGRTRSLMAAFAVDGSNPIGFLPARQSRAADPQKGTGFIRQTVGLPESFDLLRHHDQYPTMSSRGQQPSRNPFL